MSDVMDNPRIYAVFKEINTLQGMFLFHVCYNKTFSKFRIKPYQLDVLLRASGEYGYYYKHKDIPLYAGKLTSMNAQGPFHTLYMVNTPAYIVLAWYVGIYFLEFHYIKPQDWIDNTAHLDKVIGYVKSKKIASFLYKYKDRNGYTHTPMGELIALK